MGKTFSIIRYIIFVNSQMIFVFKFINGFYYVFFYD